MSRVNTRKIATALAILAMAALISGCGSATPPGAPPIAPAPPAGVGNGAYPNGGCIPISQPIGFTTQGGYIDSINVRAGMIPSVDPFAPGQTVGQVMVSVGGAGGPYQAPNNQLTIAPDGSISMNVTTPATTAYAGYGGYGAVGGYGGMGTNAAMTGTISVSPTKQQMVYQSFGGAAYNPYTTPVPQVGATTGPCVTGVAISLSHNGYNLYGGAVYLYLYTPTTAYAGTMPNMYNYGNTGRGTIIKF